MNLAKNLEVDALGFFFYVVLSFSAVSVNLPKNPEEDASEHLNRSARFARCARSLAALAEGILFALWRRVVSSAFGKAPKHLRKIYASDF